MAKATQSHRHLAVNTPLGDDVLLVESFAGTEELGRLFNYQVSLLAADQSVSFSALLGQNMTVRLERPNGVTRYFNGYVARMAQMPSPPRYARYRATLVPWLWFLTRSADCRIFQDMAVPDIVKKVLGDHGFSDIEDHLSGSYSSWDYCVQYRETAFDFVSRLMEHEGIYYFFSHENGKHKLHLCDAPSGHELVPGYDKTPYREPSAVGPREAIWGWSVEQELQTGRCALNAFDFVNTTTDLNTKAASQRPEAPANLEIYDFPGRYTATSEGEAYAKIRLQEFEARAQVATAETDSRGVAVGTLIELADHPRADQNRKYLVFAASYDFRNDVFDSGEPGANAAACRLEAVPSDAQFRTARLTRVPTIQGPQTAIVVGPSGEEIYTDEHGRVKVMFHWDREAKADENSSCWIRVAQVWAGKKWGGVFTPRIGQEVIVEFLEGDPDRPIITGRVYNGQSKPPYTLPDMATISGLKSNTSKGGAGFNEIRFEDKKDNEQLFLSAQKNMDTRVVNDAFEFIGHDRHLIVKNDRIEKVENDRHETVTRDHLEEIGRDRNLKVKGKQASEVVGTLSLKVTDDVAEKFGKNQSTEVTKDLYIKADNICIEGGTNVTIKVGETFIALESGGVKISTTGDIKLEAKGKTSVLGTAGLSLEGTAQAELKSPNTTVKGDGMVTVQGGMVKIN